MAARQPNQYPPIRYVITEKGRQYGERIRAEAAEAARQAHPLVAHGLEACVDCQHDHWDCPAERYIPCPEPWCVCQNGANNGNR